MNAPSRQPRFRLYLNATPGRRPVEFSCSRADFRYELASAFIDLRRHDQRSPVILEILAGNGPHDWDAPADDSYLKGFLNQDRRQIRWDCSGGIFDRLVSFAAGWEEAKHTAMGNAGLKPA